VWSGDIPSTFETLQTQVRAGLSIGLSGIPWWASDIGGFYDGDPQDPVFRELMVRWFQYSVFTPILRLHGYRKPGDIERFWERGGANEVWSFGDEVYGLLVQQLFLRERLRPYIMRLMADASATGAPPMRPLFFHFPEDEAAWRIEDSYLFGPDLLVAPILQWGQRRRQVYLPSGASWRDAWSDQIFEGGQWITADAPLSHIPLFLRDDAHLPIREVD
jgi:alpha-D-xyloside xylohydrolase